ncbi:hypothetical protein VNI00_006680 [Paramarasmius palmivorus]|uniref:Thioredoxin n=1 Tax=Paramarasmius palmivorus TaxID=297713 RepID=A0AAW0D8J3_9AGAR
MPVKAIESYDEFKKIISSDKVVIIDFWATWCGPCKIISPIFEQLSNQAQFAESVEFYKVDVDAQEDISAEVGVRAMPTFVAFKNGQKLGEPVVGANPQALQALVSKVASS